MDRRSPKLNRTPLRPEIDPASLRGLPLVTSRITGGRPIPDAERSIAPGVFLYHERSYIGIELIAIAV